MYKVFRFGVLTFSIGVIITIMALIINWKFIGIISAVFLMVGSLSATFAISVEEERGNGKENARETKNKSQLTKND